MKYAKWILALAAAVLPSLAAAQLNSSQKIVAQVPFEFTVANKIVPAGQYTVQSATMDGKVLTIGNVRAKVGVLSPSLVDESKKPADSYVMVFKRYGSQSFLWEIKIKGSRVICRLPESKAEAEFRAQNVTATEQVLLASLR
jgi:hypothetical protein